MTYDDLIWLTWLVGAFTAVSLAARYNFIPLFVAFLFGVFSIVLAAGIDKYGKPWYLAPSSLPWVVFFYVAAGILWSMTHWSWYQHQRVKDFQTVRRQYLVLHGVDPAEEIPPHLLGYWKSTVAPTSNHPSGNLKAVIWWIVAWPFSLFGWFLVDLVINILVHIYRTLRSENWSKVREAERNHQDQKSEP